MMDNTELQKEEVGKDTVSDMKEGVADSPGPNAKRHSASFSRMFDKQNTCMDAAIKSLDNLNDQIVQFIFTPKSAEPPDDEGGGKTDLTPRDRETLRSSMGIMRRLLVDAQSKFRKMVEDNRVLASRIDGSIQTANEEVNTLRMELLDTNKRLSQLSQLTLTGSQAALSGSQTGLAGSQLGLAGDVNIEAQEAVGETQTIPDNDVTKQRESSNQDAERISDLEAENNSLRQEIARLHKEIQELKEHGGGATEAEAVSPGKMRLETQLVQAQGELAKILETVQAMKVDRKRLKAEKLELLGQMRQLYSTLEDKESELRHFIRSYEQRMRETDESVKELAFAKEEADKERWESIQKCQEAELRATKLQAQLDERQNIIDTLTTQLRQFKDQLQELGVTPPSNNLKRSSGSVSDDSVLKSSSLDGHSPGSCEELPAYQEVEPQQQALSIMSLAPPPTGSEVNVNEPVVLMRQKEATPPLPSRTNEILRSRETTPVGSITSTHSNGSTAQLQGDCSNLSLEQISAPMAESSRSSEDMVVASSDGTYVTIASDMHIVQRRPRDSKIRDSSRDRRRKSPGPLSRIFGRSRSRRSIAVTDPSLMDAPDGLVATSSRLSLLTQDNYQEKLSLVGQAQALNVSSWKASHVLAWLEVDMNMPVYGRACGQNIKSGKVLLGLSDAELDSALGLRSPLHRRKLRLAIEELRDPALVKFPKASHLDHTWVAHRLLPELGLPQYSTSFEEQLVDGRLLNVLSRKDLERHLSIQRKFHQASILHAVELLRRINFDKEVLNDRRQRTEDNDGDPLVWTNHRLIRWLNSIDLEEYTHNLRESGVHGAVLVLEPTFTPDTFAAALGIPASKAYVRRHLATEMEALVRPARAALEAASRKGKPPSGGSLGRSFSRSFRGGSSTDHNGFTKRHSLRGSFGKAFGRGRNKGTSDQSLSGSGTDGSAPVPASSALTSHHRSHSMELSSTPM